MDKSGDVSVDVSVDVNMTEAIGVVDVREMSDTGEDKLSQVVNERKMPKATDKMELFWASYRVDEETLFARTSGLIKRRSIPVSFLFPDKTYSSYINTAKDIKYTSIMPNVNDELFKASQRVSGDLFHTEASKKNIHCLFEGKDLIAILNRYGYTRISDFRCNCLILAYCEVVDDMLRKKLGVVDAHVMGKLGKENNKKGIWFPQEGLDVGYISSLSYYEAIRLCLASDIDIEDLLPSENVSSTELSVNALREEGRHDMEKQRARIEMMFRLVHGYKSYYYSEIVREMLNKQYITNVGNCSIPEVVKSRLERLMKTDVEILKRVDKIRLENSSFTEICLDLYTDIAWYRPKFYILCMYLAYMTPRTREKDIILREKLGIMYLDSDVEETLVLHLDVFDRMCKGGSPDNYREMTDIDIIKKMGLLGGRWTRKDLYNYIDCNKSSAEDMNIEAIVVNLPSDAPINNLVIEC